MRPIARIVLAYEEMPITTEAFVRKARIQQEYSALGRATDQEQPRFNTELR